MPFSRKGRGIWQPFPTEIRQICRLEEQKSVKGKAEGGQKAQNGLPKIERKGVVEVGKWEVRMVAFQQPMACLEASQ